jgi:hypothetical protein
MPITTVKKTEWGPGIKLQKGSEIMYLHLEAEISRRIGSHNAAAYLDRDFRWPNTKLTTTMVRTLHDRDVLGLEHPMVIGNAIVYPLNEAEIRRLDRLQKQLSMDLKTQQAAISACAPIVDFISKHVDIALYAAIKETVENSDMPAPLQLGYIRKILGDQCLVDPLSARDTLMTQFKMGTATTPMEVIQVLDNYGIILQDIKTLYAMVTGLEDEARTLMARKIDPDALPIMRMCTPPPTDQELFHLLRNSIQSTAANSIIMGTLHTLRYSTFEELNIIVKQTAEQCFSHSAPVQHSAHHAGIQDSSEASEKLTAEPPPTLGKRRWEDTDTFAGGFAAATALQKSLQQPVQQQWPSWNPGYYGPTNTPTCTQPWDDRFQMCEYQKRNGYCKFTHHQQHGQQPRSPSLQGQLGGQRSSLAIPEMPTRSLNFAPATFLPPLRMPSPSPAPAAGTSPGRRPATPF